MGGVLPRVPDLTPFCHMPIPGPASPVPDLDKDAVECALLEFMEVMFRVAFSGRLSPPAVHTEQFMQTNNM